MNDAARFYYIISLLPEKIRRAVNVALLSGKPVEEIRIRKNLPVSLTVSGKSMFLKSDGECTFIPYGALVCPEDTFKTTFLNLCENSVFAHTKEIENGYVAVKGGFRVGVCGEFSSGVLPELNSLNIRLAREVKGCAKDLSDAFCGGMLIAGPPCCGKTTVLRDLIRLLSEKGRRVAVVDSRREISGGTGQNPFDLGPNTDIIYSSDKARGSEMALRTMFPQIIAFDEISGVREVESVLSAFNSGVDILTTAHIGNFFELKTRPSTKKLLESGVIKSVAVMSVNIGEKIKIYSIGDVFDRVFN